MIKNLKLTDKATCLAAMLAAVLLAPATKAQVITLQDGNSSAVVNVNSSAGMSQWLVDGVNNLDQQWFWFRTGTGTGYASPINAINSASYNQSGANTLNTLYANSSYGVDVNYSLTGGGTGSADIQEGITIYNYSSTTLNFTFYQYSHFNLLNTPGDTVMMDQSEAYQYKGPNQIAEGIVSPVANEFEANITGGAGSGSTLDKLNSTKNLVLDNNSQAGPGDVTWAYEWDLSIDPNSDVVITKDKLLNIQVVPEPPTLKVVALGFSVFLFRRSLNYWKQKRSH